ncbi:protein LDOC1-like [Rana temporaria]|uniref:protein LDOC1-like n=1 Tax=Rana temporaria TaxID=8407 RepID=UPI001AADABE2|nr:protein LDOC1-like [Rana temporaria]
MEAAIAKAVAPLRQQLLELQQEVLLLKGTVGPALEPACPEPFVVMPERFDGSRASFLCFKVDCELLFALKPRTYATDYIKVRATINLLTGPIKAWAHQVLQERSPVLDSWEAFM